MVEPLSLTWVPESGEAPWYESITGGGCSCWSLRIGVEGVSEPDPPRCPVGWCWTVEVDLYVDRCPAIGGQTASDQDQLPRRHPEDGIGE